VRPELDGCFLLRRRWSPVSLVCTATTRDGTLFFPQPRSAPACRCLVRSPLLIYSDVPLSRRAFSPVRRGTFFFPKTDPLGSCVLHSCASGANTPSRISTFSPSRLPFPSMMLRLPPGLTVARGLVRDHIDSIRLGQSSVPFFFCAFLKFEALLILSEFTRFVAEWSHPPALRWAVLSV